MIDLPGKPVLTPSVSSPAEGCSHRPRQSSEFGFTIWRLNWCSASLRLLAALRCGCRNDTNAASLIIKKISERCGNNSHRLAVVGSDRGEPDEVQRKSL